MTHPDPLPIRVLYKGASTVLWQSSTDRRPPHALPYPRVVERSLRSRGHAVDTHVAALSAVQTKTITRTWEAEASASLADVVVMHHGHLEAIHAIIPRWAERYARSGYERPGRWRDRYRQRLVNPAYKLLTIVQQRIDRALPEVVAARLARRRADLTVTHLERYVDRMSRFTDPLVIVMGLIPPGPLWDDWFPGVRRRMTAIDQAMREMVARRDSSRLVYLELWDEARAWEERGEDPRPDGGHYSPAFHELVGERLADVVAAWAAEQPHLR